jgi:hypothetical protein
LRQVEIIAIAAVVMIGVVVPAIVIVGIRRKF